MISRAVAGLLFLALTFLLVGTAVAWIAATFAVVSGKVT